MTFVKPMLASPLPANFTVSPGIWSVEEKIDGHRLIVEVGGKGIADLFGQSKVTAWSRHGKLRMLPPHVRKSLELLPHGVYDGELVVPGSRSYGVTVLEDSDKLVFTMFDIIELIGRNLTITGIEGGATYDERRAALEMIFSQFTEVTPGLVLATSIPVDSLEQVDRLRDAVWANDGEGLILKKRSSKYVVGKRPKDWLKIKDLKSAVLTVIGFRDGTRGPDSVPILRDSDGNETTVKAKNDETLAQLQADPKKFLGRSLRIEYQERTPDGSYRHPRWDRWEDE